MPLLCSAVATDTANTAPRYMCHPFGCTPELMKRGHWPKKMTHMSSLILRKTNSRPRRRKKDDFQVPTHGIVDNGHPEGPFCVSANARRPNETLRGFFFMTNALVAGFKSQVKYSTSCFKGVASRGPPLCAGA